MSSAPDPQPHCSSDLCAPTQPRTPLNAPVRWQKERCCSIRSAHSYYTNDGWTPLIHCSNASHLRSSSTRRALETVNPKHHRTHTDPPTSAIQPLAGSLPSHEPAARGGRPGRTWARKCIAVQVDEQPPTTHPLQLFGTGTQIRGRNELKDGGWHGPVSQAPTSFAVDGLLHSSSLSALLRALVSSVHGYPAWLPKSAPHPPNLGDTLVPRVLDIEMRRGGVYCKVCPASVCCWHSPPPQGFSAGTRPLTLRQRCPQFRLLAALPLGMF